MVGIGKGLFRTPPESLLRRVLAGAACALVYFIVLEAFLAVPMFNGETQIRPASGLGPVFGLMFGAPAVLGCAVANMLSDAAHGSDAVLLLPYFLIQLVYDGLPRLLWRLARKGDGNFATFRLDSSARIAGFIGMALLDSAVVAAMLAPFEDDAMAALNIHIVHALNNFLSLVYVGIPVLLVVGFVKRKRTGVPVGLAQRAALGALLGACLVSTVCALVLFLPRALEATDADSFARLMAGVYISMSVMTGAMFALACALLRMVETRLARPIDRLSESSREFPERFEEEGPEAVAAGALDEKPEGKEPLREIAGLISASNTMRRDLGKSVLASKRAELAKQRVSAEIGIAARIQEEMLPKDFTELRERYGLEIDACMLPARQVGGDFYDVFSVDDSRVCLLVADVSDKGVPASLFMMRAMVELRDCVRSGGSVSEALAAANLRLCKGNDSSLFVTAFVVVLDVRTGRAECANAGHNLPWKFGADGRVAPVKAKPGLPLGMMTGVRYRSLAMPLLPGEGLLLYTDGVTEAANESLELYGTERLQAVLESVKEDGPGRSEHAVRAVAMDVGMFSGDAEQADDITMLSFTWLSKSRALSVGPETEECDAAVDFFREAFIERKVSKSIVYDVALIVEEVFVNIALHAFEDGREKKPVLLMAGTDPACGVLHMVFCDEGVPYDPTQRETKPVSKEDDVLVPGGLGVLLAEKKSDSMLYDRVDGKNVLHVIKRLD